MLTPTPPPSPSTGCAWGRSWSSAATCARWSCRCRTSLGRCVRRCSGSGAHSCARTAIHRIPWSLSCPGPVRKWSRSPALSLSHPPQKNCSSSSWGWRGACRRGGHNFLILFFETSSTDLKFLLSTPISSHWLPSYLPQDHVLLDQPNLLQHLLHDLQDLQ